MNVVAIETQLIIGIVTLLVFYFLIKKTIKNISSNNDDGDKIIDLNKLSKRGRKKK